MPAYRYDGVIRNGQGYALSGVEIYVCSQPVTSEAIPPTPLATLFTDSTGMAMLANPVQSDGLGNFFFYVATGLYTLIYYDPLGRIPQTVFPDQLVATQGGGSVTSVALTVPTDETVSGSPISTSGTLAITRNVQNAHAVLAGPTSGPSATPTFRPLVSADLPAGGGSVTSVALAAVVGALFSQSVSGSPVTSSGTLQLTLDLANQLANLFLAGPVSGGAGAVTARKIAPADLAAPGVYSGVSPVFNAAINNVFTITLTGNTTSSITGMISGGRYTFIITQGGSGGYSFAFPSQTRGQSNVEPTLAAVSVQEFVYDGAFLRATGPGSVNFR